MRKYKFSRQDGKVQIFTPDNSLLTEVASEEEARELLSRLGIPKEEHP